MMDVLPSGRHGRGRARMPRKAVVVGTTTAMLLTAGGIGYAAWTVTATGSSEAASGAPVTGVVSVAAPVAKLYPGGSTPLYFTVSNPNDFPVTYSAASFGAVTSNSVDCPPGTYITTTNQPVSVTVPAKGSSGILTPAGAITMKIEAPDKCQNVTFTVATTVTGVSG